MSSDLSPEELRLISFRYGYLRRCAERGLSADEADYLAEQQLQHGRWLKQASPPAATASILPQVGAWLLSRGEHLLGRGFGWLENMVPYVTQKLILPAVFGIGPVAGLAGGLALGKLHDIEYESEDEQKLEDLTEAYREAARRLGG